MQNSNARVRLKSPDILSELPPQALTLISLSDRSIQNEIARALNVTEYALGEDIPLSISPNKNRVSETVAGEIHAGEPVASIVCKGRVRLLAHSKPEEVTVGLLGVDKCFGGDRIFIPDPFLYRAIASSDRVCIATVPIATLEPAFKTNRRLRDYWQEQTQIRDRLIFFRLKTALRSHASHQLAQWMSYIQVRQIPAGTLLSQATTSAAGRYWLRSGVVEGEKSEESEAICPPLVGDSWGYSTQTQRASEGSSAGLEAHRSWIAHTDLSVYFLPVSAWAIAKAFTTDLDTAQLDGSSLSARALDERSPKSGIKSKSQPRRRSRPIAVTAKGSTQPATTQPFNSPPAEPPRFPKPPKRILLDALRRYPWVEQQSATDCGAACLSMCARYWGKRFPLHVLRERANVGRSGTSIKSLARAAEEIGFHARPVRASLGSLANHQGPWIAHWEGIHYVVVYKTTSHHVIIADPAAGRKKIPKALFLQKWTGFGLLLSPTDQLQQTEIKQASLGRYAKALLPYRGLIVQIICISLLIQCFGVITPLFTQVILDRVVVQKSVSTLNVFVIGLLVFGLWGLIMSAARQYLLSYFSNRLDLTLVSGFIRHVMSLPMRFFESRRVGDILTRVQENQKIQQFLIGQVVLAWLNLATGFVYLALMLYYNWQLTVLALMMIPPIVIITLGSTPFLRQISRQVFKEAADQNSALVEMVSGIATVKTTATEQEMRWRWEDHLTRQMNARFKGQKLGIGLQSLSGSINSVGSTLLLWYGATLVIQGQLTVGQFVAFNMMIGRVISPVVALAGLWDELQEVLISVERLNDVFESPAESARGGMVIPPLRGEVAFEDVTFRYGEDDEHNTLQNISLSVEPGTTVAIVGRSGSGKSTFIKLLEGLYLPDKGRVLIDGHDIAHIEPISLRSQLGVVPQECFLFSGTLLENITLHRENVTLEDAIAAAKLAEAHGFIQTLPMGYSTKVGERGATLSGGQRQRIAIARALLGQPRILILDEATSALDTESERQFQQNLERISQSCTTFIIAHRLSTVRNADCIIVLDRGVIVEQGTHAELIAQAGLYHSLAQQQLNL